jgi:hypothetical protein
MRSSSALWPPPQKRKAEPRAAQPLAQHVEFRAHHQDVADHQQELPEPWQQAPLPLLDHLAKAMHGREAHAVAIQLGEEVERDLDL